MVLSLLDQESLADELLDPLLNVLLAVLLEDAPRAKLVVAPLQNPLLTGAGQHFGDITRGEVFAHLQHARENVLRDLHAILNYIEHAEAHVARLTRSIVPGLPEVPED